MLTGKSKLNPTQISWKKSRMKENIYLKNSSEHYLRWNVLLNIRRLCSWQYFTKKIRLITQKYSIHWSFKRLFGWKHQIIKIHSNSCETRKSSKSYLNNEYRQYTFLVRKTWGMCLFYEIIFEYSSWSWRSIESWDMFAPFSSN